jgi:hypothetical protein
MRLSLSGGKKRLRNKLMQRLRRIGQKDKRRKIGRKGRDQPRIGRMIEGRRAVDVYRTHL